MTTHTAPAWCEPGAAVTIIRDPHGMAGVRYTDTTIERVLKRDVVLADPCGRFSLARPGGRDGARLVRRPGGTWDPPEYLVPADSPAAHEARAAAARNDHLHQALTAADNLTRALRGRNTTTARDAATRVLQHLDRYDAITTTAGSDT